MTSKVQVLNGEKKAVSIFTFGCKLNFSESSTLERSFEKQGYTIIGHEEFVADIFVINTCSVTENADSKCKKLVAEIKKKAPSSIVCIIGCFAQLKTNEIKSITGVDIVIGAKDKFNTVDIITLFISKKKENQPSESLKIAFPSDVNVCTQFIPTQSINERTRAYVKVQDGCDYSCSFCTIPLARGKSRSESVENVANRIESLKSFNIKEVVLTGINLGDYGIVDDKRRHTFFDLLIRLEKIEHINRYRISSIEPNLLSDDILELVSLSDKIVPHFHIPLQSGSVEILKQMRRRYSVDLYEKKIQQVLSTIPEVSIGVDVIVGFPGETDAHFDETYNFLSALDISYLHVFPYSEREHTVAKGLPHGVAKSIKAERAKRLRLLSEKKKKAFYSKNIGKQREVLFEKGDSSAFIYGYTDNYIKVKHPYDKRLVNTIKKVEMVNMDSHGMMLLKRENGV